MIGNALYQAVEIITLLGGKIVIDVMNLNLKEQIWAMEVEVRYFI